MFSTNIESKMHFSTPTSFFNVEFSSEKEFVFGENGIVTGYRRSVNGKEHPPAVKVTKVDTLPLMGGELNNIGWHLLAIGQPAEAEKFFSRSLQLKPDDLMCWGNLAHCYLFTNNYKSAIDIYKTHMKETIVEGLTWEQMIKQDFIFFKSKGHATGPMDKVFEELQMKKPAGY